MNKIYKVIWNAALQCWVAVSELGKAKGKTKSKKVLSAAAVMAVSAVGVSTNVEAAVNYATGTTFGGGMAIGSRSYANINATAYGHEANARALEDVAIGYKTISGAAVSGSTSHSSAQASVAVGTYANATHVATTAIGAHASAINNFATAVGAGALANKENGSAFGQGAMATGVYATALGKGALAKQDYSVALGKEAAANTQLTTSIGSKTNATGFSAIAIGSGHVPATGTVVIEDIQGAQATADDSMAVGASALANKEGATALGKLSKATNNNAVAVGPDSVASGSWATATGASANASGQASAAFGESARAGGKKSIATGSHASASGENAIASGANAIATKNGATAVGANTEASGDKATALGDLAKAKNNRATALGHDSQATGEFSTAVGVSSRASGVASVATGKNATASGSNAIATGNASNAAGADSIASGRQASATGTGAVATGAEASASGNAAAYGNQAKATGGWSSAFGNEAKATQSDASAFGNSANASTQGATAVGAHSSVTASGGVALGNGAVANRAARDRNTIVINTADPSKTTGLSDNNNGGDANTVYAPVRLVDTPGALNAIKNTINGNKGAVSVGDSGNTRQIINVAAGSADSDAVNVAQLKAVAGAIKKYSVTSPDGSITVTNPTPGSDPQNFQIKMNTTAVQNAAQWYVKEGTETSGTAVRGGNTVSFNDSSTVDVQHNNKNFTFNVKSGDVTANTNTGAITAPTDGNVLAKAKNVAEAIQRSGWELQANGTKVGLVNPGDTVNIASGNGITVTPTTESRGVSKVTINAKVAGIKAGNNVTVSEAGGVYTINANDTNTQASVEAEGSFVNVKNTARNTSNNTVKYQVSVTTNDVSMNTATGATNQATATGLTTNKAVADAIAKSGFQLKENGKLKNVVNPGESLNFKPGQGTTVSVGTNGDVQVNANVADIRAGNNVTVTKGNNGVVTINANDTNTQASVANGTGLTLTESNNSNGTKKYTLGVNVDNNTIKVENGKLVANLSNVVDTNTQSTVEAKANNFVTVDGSTKNTNGTTKYQVGVTTGDVAVTEATGAVTAISAATGVATNKTVADAIAKSGFQLQENGTLRNVVNPGEILNFKPGKGTTVSVGKNGDVQINANVAGITAGKNITTNTDTNGNVTINAKDTSAHVQAANNAAVKVDKAATTRTENNADITDYTVDLTDQTKTNITHGVNANETVTNKGLTFNGNTGSTGIKKLGSEVDVKGNTSNNVITTTANTNGITVDYNGTAAAQVTSLTYKANNANAKSVTLAKGLDFTNGTQTTAEVGDNGVVKFNVNTTTLSNATANGNIQVPTGANSDGLVTAKNVANAINTSGWNLQANNVSVGLINPSDKVSFDAGNGVTVTSTNEANGVSHIKVAAKVDGSTITVNDQGQLVANLSGAVNTQASVVNATSSPITIATTQNTNGTNNYTVDVNVDGKTITKEGGVLKAVIPSVETVTLTVNTTGNNAGKVEAPTTEADKKKLVTAENVAKAINESYWVAKRGDSVTTNADSGDGDSNVAAGNNVTFVAGKNMALQKAGNKFIYATKDDVTFNNVTANNTTTTNLTVNKGGNVDMGGNQVHNVSTGTAPTDAVNVKQLYDTVSGNVSTESVIKKADEDNIAEVSPKAGQTVGDKNATYEVSVSKAKIKALANETVKVNTSTAANNPITVTPHTENGNTTYTVNFDGAKAASEIPLTYKANDGAGKTVKLSEGLNFKNGTQTTAEVGDNGVVKFNVNTTTLSNTTANGKITVPDGNGLVTAKEVANAINAANWKLNVNGDNKQSVSAGDIVNFADGNGTTVTYKDGAVRVNANVTDVVSANGNATITRDPNTGIVTVNAKDTNTQASVKNGSGITVTPSTNANGTANYTVAVNVDGSTITVNNDGKLVANVPDTSKVSLTNNAGKVGDVSTGDANKFVTGDNLAKTINATYWKASQGTHEENTSEETTGVASSEIKPGDELTFVSGKNMALKKNGNKFVYATKDDVVFNNVTANNTTTTNFTVKNGGNVDMGGNQVHNVSTGTAPTDAVNVKQLYDTVSGNVSTESVIKKADEDNIAEVSPKAGQTVGDKNATYEVSVSKAKIKALANETVKVNTSTAANNPITVTPHTENGNTTYTVNFDGAKAASEIPLTYKANDGAGKTVKLSEGLNFKNGTQTTAEVGDNGVVKFNVNTTTLSNTTANGKITVPDGNGLVTAKEVANAINAANWKLNVNGDNKQSVSAGDIVNFADGNGTTVTYKDGAVRVNANVTDVVSANGNATITRDPNTGIVTVNAKDTNTQASVKNGSGITVTPSTNANGTANYTVAVNVDGSTITVNNDGKLVANVPDTSKVSLTNNAGKVGDVSTGDANKFVTGDNLAKTINATYWKASQGTHEENTSEETTGVASSEIKPGDELTFVSGKNMALKKNGNKFVYATKDDVVFNNVTANNTTTTNFTVKNGGNVDMGGNQVHNVSTGTAPTDAVNVKQLYDTVSGNVSTESVIKKADEDNIAEVSPKAGQTVGDKNATYEVSVSKAKIKALANETVKVNTSTAANNPITVTPHTENGNTTYTVNFDGAKAASEIPLTYKANDGAGKTVKLSEGLNFKNGTQTTAEVGDNGVVKFNVNTTTLSNTTANGKITVPDGNGLVTAKEVANAINAANWKLNVNGDNKQSVSAGDIVNFADGNGTTVTYKDGAVRVNANVTDVVSANGNATITRDPNTGIVTVNAKDTNTQASVKNGSGITVTPSTNANGTANYTVAVNVDGSTITVNNDGKLVANVPDTSKVSLTNNAGKVGDVSTGDANKFVTGDNLAKTINATYWKASQGTHEENTSEETTGVASSEIKPGDELTFVSGKNMALKKNGNKFVYATKDDVVFNNVTANNTTTTNFTVKNGGNVDMGGNQVHNVSTGTAPTDAVNVKQLYDTVSGNVSTESVIKKADEDNIAEVSPKAGQTVGDKNATYEVSVSKAKIKALANETVKVNTSTAANNPITVTPHTENGNTTYTVNFDGAKAASEIPLTYKANDGAGKTVKLSEGLNFKNGTQTTAEVGDNGVVKFNVNTTTLSNTTANGKITVPDGNGLVTAKEVANAINAANWKLNVNGDNKQSVSAGDIVNFADGNGTTVTYKDGAVRVNANVTDVVSANGNATITRDPNTGIVTVNAKDTNTQASVKNGSGITVTPSTNANGTANYTVAVNVDGSTITVNNDGKLVANVPDTSKVSLTNNAGKVGDVSTGDANKFVTGDNLAKTINATYWKASQGTHEENTSEETTGVASSEIKPGDELTFVSGKNMALKKNGNKFVYATKDDVVFNNVTANNTTTTNFTVKNGGNVDMGGNQVHNVSTGTAPTDAVNVKQLYDTVSGNVSTESVIKKADEDNIAEVSPKAGQTVGDKNATYEVSVSKAKIKALANETVKVNTSTAANNPITVTPHTENGNTTYTVNFDGVKAAAEIPLTYKANDGTGKTVKLSEGLNFKNGTQTTAEVGDNGVVKFNVNTTTLSNTTANGKITVPDGNGLVTAKEVAEAINASYWKANAGGNVDGATVTDNVTTGTEVFFAAGKNLKVKHSANNFTFSTADDVSFNNVTTNNLTVNAKGNVDMGGNQVHNVANGTKGTDAVNLDQLNATTATAKTEVKAGKNVSSVNESKDAKDGHTVYTIDAVDTSAHVKAAESNAAVKVEKAVTTRTDGNTTVTDYTVDLTDETKANITHGVNANTTVTTKGLTFNGNEGTTGIKKLGSEVDVKGGTANNVITTNATEAGITINYNGTEAAKVTHLTYKANGANAQSVNLTTGLDFTNGTQTTAEVAANGVVKFNVNTTALSNVTNNGKITVPEGNGLVTAKEVAEAINASYWKANAGGNVDGATVTDNITTGTEVFFAAGKNLKVKHSANNFTFSTADDVSFNNVTTNNLTVNAKGNVDMGGNQVHNVANGTKGTDAVNLDQLNATTATANAGWVIKANGTNATTVKPNATVSLNNTDGNILITKNTANNNVTFNFNPNATFGVVGKDGKDGVDGSIGVNGKDGASVVIDGKNGSIGLTGPKGKDGKDGVSLTLKPEKGTTTVNAKDDGKEIERIKYTANGTTREVATLDDGLKFAGDDNKTINRTLGSLLNITGGATDSTTANNIRVTNDGKNGLRVQLANNVTFDANGSVKIGNTTVNNGGLTINGGPSITKDSGVNAGNKAISNVSTGVKDNDAVNVKQLKDSVSTESVVAKTGTDNIAEVSPKAGQTLGDKNAQYEVSVSKAKVKDAAVEAVKVNATTGSPITVTTTADAANNSTTYTVNFNGDNAAKEIPLTYKSNGNASTAKTVKLSDGLDFTNGTLTTAVVGDNGVVKFNVNQGAFNTTTADANGKLNNASKEGVSTVEDVIKAVNAAGWVVTSGNTSTGTVSGTSREVINPGDAVKFIAGQNVDITQDKGNFTIATRENVSFTTVTVGKDGKNGKDGLIGVNGTDGASVVINGKDGSIGLTGPKGKDGVSITLKPEKGTTTVNATDAGKEIDRIKYTDTNGTTREVATLDDGLKFKGDSSQVINRTLGSQMNITGGADETTLTDNNIGVVYDKATDGLKVKLAKDVNLTTNGSVVIGNTTLNNNGFTITNKADPSKTVSVTDKGLNNGGNTIINVAPGVNGTDAVNLDQLNATTAIANAGWVIKANGTNATTVKPNATVSLNNTDGNILITKNKTDNNVTFNFNPNATFGVVGKDGKDGVDGSIGVNGKDGSSVVINGKDGSIGLNGKDGKNGLSIKGDQGPAGVDGKDGETKTRIVYEYADPKDPNKTIRENVATLNDGLRFTGNNGVENAHRLNTLVTIVGEGVDKAASANFTSASGNINVKADGKGTLEVQLAKNLKNIETINNGNSTITLNKDGGTTISGGDVSVDGNKVTNVKDGDVSANSKDAVNGSQLYHVMTNATAGWNLSVNNGKDKGNVKPGAQVDLNNTDGNIIISKTANNVTFNFNPNATFGVKGKDGKDGVDGSIGVNGKDGASVVINGKDGSIGLTGPKGADGKDGASANMSVQKGTTTVNTDRDGGKDVTRIVYTDKDKDGKDIKREVATLDDGLKFKGDSEQVINRTLGSQMNITGGADSTKLTDNNIGVVYDEATNGLKVKLSKDVDLGKDGSITIGGTQVTNNGLTIKNGPSVTEKGVDAGNKKVTNVADGDINETSKDAVNGSQLYQAVNNINKNVNAAKTELEEGDNVTITSRVGNNGQTIYKVSSTDNSAHVQGGSDAVSVTKAETTRKDGSTTVTDYTVDLSSKTKDDIKKGVDAHDTVTNKGLTFNADKGTTGAKKLGSQVAVNGDNKNIETVADTNGVKVKLKDDINVNSVTANTFKAGDTIVNTKGVQVAAKDDRGNNTNVVINEKGINAGNTRIQNVAAGRADTDAVNVSQLKGAVTQIGNHINKMDKNLRAGIAGAMAAGGLYHATLPGKSMVAAGAGTYKGESAVAVGYSRLSDNGKVGIKFSVNTNTRGDAGAAASVGYQW